MKLTIELEPRFDAGDMHAATLSWPNGIPITCRLHFVDLPGAGRCMVVCGSQVAVTEAEKAVRRNSDALAAVNT